MIRKIAIPFLFAAIITTWTSPALAEKIVWQTTAMSCTPTSTTASEKKYVTTAGRVKFRDGQSGRISFTCPVSLPSGVGTYYIQGAFTSPSFQYGKGNSVQLRHAHKRTGAVSTILSATIRMENQPKTKFGTVTSGPKKYSVNKKDYVHWVSFSLSRPTGNGVSPAFLGVEIIRR